MRLDCRRPRIGLCMRTYRTDRRRPFLRCRPRHSGWRPSPRWKCLGNFAAGIRSYFCSTPRRWISSKSTVWICNERLLLCHCMHFVCVTKPNNWNESQEGRQKSLPWTHLVGTNLIFTFSMRTYSWPSRVSILGITFAWMLTFSVEWRMEREHLVLLGHLCRTRNVWLCVVNLPKVRLASPFPTIGRNSTLPSIVYLPEIVKRFDRPSTSNFDFFGSRSKPLQLRKYTNKINFY